MNETQFLNEIEKPIVMYDYKECCRMARFFKDIGYTILPCDDPLQAIRGFAAFKKSEDGVEDYIEDDAKKGVWFGDRFAKPIKNIENVGVNDDSNVKMKECLTEDGWFKCDDPKNLKIGFVNYHKSICRYFRISIVKMFLPDIFEKMEVYRNKDEKNSFNIRSRISDIENHNPSVSMGDED